MCFVLQYMHNVFSSIYDLEIINPVFQNDFLSLIKSWTLIKSQQSYIFKVA